MTTLFVTLILLRFLDRTFEAELQKMRCRPFLLTPKLVYELHILCYYLIFYFFKYKGYNILNLTLKDFMFS